VIIHAKYVDKSRCQNGDMKQFLNCEPTYLTPTYKIWSPGDLAPGTSATLAYTLFSTKQEITK